MCSVLQSFRENVSIHATLAGGDCEAPPTGMRRWCFYPRHPRGWRRGLLRERTTGAKFLSTPPSRVATLFSGFANNSGRCFYPRHPRGWRPSECRDEKDSQNSFYPRHPRGWRRAEADFIDTRLQQFLSTPPSRVATCFLVSNYKRINCFYPRHPRGWRRDGRACMDARSLFLSTPPSRVATEMLSCPPLLLTTFLSTPPSRVATGNVAHKFIDVLVSIHATLAGGDCILLAFGV